MARPSPDFGWGAVHNDSASVRKDQSFEIALTEKDGKVTGYSRNEFIVNDTLYYIVKKVKGSINGNKCEVTDDEVVSYNFPGKLEKGITVSSFFYLNTITNTWKLDSWKTNVPRRKYYSVGGKMDMETEADLASSKLFAHLEELNKADDVAFYKERKEEQSAPVVKIARPEKVQTEYTDKIPDNTATDMAVRKPELPVPVKVVPPVAVVTAKNEEAAKPTLNESGSSQPALAKTETAPVLTTVENPVILPTNTTADKPAGKKETAVTNETAKPVAIAAVKTESTTAPTATGSANPVTTAGGKTEQAQATTNPVKKSDNTAIAGNQNNTITKPPVGTKQVNQAPVTGATGNPVARTGSNPKPAVPQPAAVTTPAPEKETDKAATAVVPVITNKTVAANPVPETRPVVIPCRQ